MKNHDVAKKIKRASWEHNIETYQGNNTRADWMTPAVSILVIVVFVAIIFIKF